MTDRDNANIQSSGVRLKLSSEATQNTSPGRLRRRFSVSISEIGRRPLQEVAMEAVHPRRRLQRLYLLNASMRFRRV